MTAAKLTRLADWPTRLDAVIEAARRRPFDWKSHNCAIFAADCVAAMTGKALHSQFAELHSNLSAARRNSKRLPKLVQKRLDAPAIAPSFAQRGDLMLLSWDGTAALGVNLGRQVACLAKEGLVFMHPGAAICAWRV